MDADPRAAITGARWIEELVDPIAEAPEYVAPLVTERLGELRRLPPMPGNLLAECEGIIVDIGPGTGTSTMALAQVAQKAQVIGLEADRVHLKDAWPLCRQYPNVRLGWGAMAGTLSNANVDTGAEPVPVAALQDAACDLLFSWSGMSRRDVYESSATWAHSVRRACVLVLPEFWRRGVSSLPAETREAFRDVCARAGAPDPSWGVSTGLRGFSRMDVWPTDFTFRARGWLLWLSGLFDGTPISLWDTLRDRRAPEPRFQTAFDVPLEVVVGTR